MSQQSSKPGEKATRAMPIVMMVLIVLFFAQLLIVQSTGVKVALSVVLIVAMGAALGWLVTSLRRDRDGVTGL